MTNDHEIYMADLVAGGLSALHVEEEITTSTADTHCTYPRGNFGLGIMAEGTNGFSTASFSEASSNTATNVIKRVHNSNNQFRWTRYSSARIVSMKKAKKNCSSCDGSAPNTSMGHRPTLPKFVARSTTLRTKLGQVGIIYGVVTGLLIELWKFDKTTQTP